MSRIGKHEVKVPASVKVILNGHQVEFSAKGVSKNYAAHELVNLDRTETGIKVTPVDETREARSLWGTTQKKE